MRTLNPEELNEVSGGLLNSVLLGGLLDGLLSPGGNSIATLNVGGLLGVVVNLVRGLLGGVLGLL